MPARRHAPPLTLPLTVGLLAACAAGPREHHVEWLEEHGRQLPADLEGPLSPEIHDLFDEAAASHRYIALAEGDHYVDDKYAYRLAFLRPLALEAGIRQIAMEIGGSDARRIDRYLDTGDEAWLGKVVLYGYSGENELEQRELRRYTQAPANACTERFVSAELRFWRSLYLLSVEAEAIDGRRLRVYGFDFDATPGGGFQDARDALASCAQDPTVTALRAELTPPSGSGGMAEVERLRGLTAAVRGASRPVDRACGAGVAERLAATLEQLASSFRIAMARASVGENADALRAHFDDREGLMERRMAALLEQLDPEEKIVLFGHNLHLAKSVDQLRFGPPSDARPMWPSLGARLEAKAPGSMYVIWLLFAEGTRLLAGGRACQPEAEVRPRRGSLEATLQAAGDRYVVPLRDAPEGGLTDDDFEFGTATSFGGGILRGAVDALVFLRRARASGHHARPAGGAPP